MLFIIIWKPYIERTTIFTIHRKKCWTEHKLQAFIQSSFLTEAMNNQTTAKIKNYSKQFCFKRDSVLKRITALWVCRFIDAQLPPQMMLFNHKLSILQLLIKLASSALQASTVYFETATIAPSLVTHPVPPIPAFRGSSAAWETILQQMEIMAQHTKVNRFQFGKFTAGILNKTYYSRS